MNDIEFENDIKSALEIKAGEAQISEEVFCAVKKRILDYEENRRNRLNFDFSIFTRKKWLTASLCGILLVACTIFVFPDYIRAFAQMAASTVKTIFVAEKDKGGYKLVQKSSTEDTIKPAFNQQSSESDAKLTEKLGFKVDFPKTIYGGYELTDKLQTVALDKKVSEDIRDKLQAVMQKAVNDDSAFSSLKSYSAYRSVSGIYKNNKGSIVYLVMWNSDIQGPLWEIVDWSTAVDTKVNNIDASWVEEVYPDYNEVYDSDGIFKSDMSTMPDHITDKHGLTWANNGVRYYLRTFRDEKIYMKDAVKIAESFMNQQK